MADTVKAYIKSADYTGNMLAEVQMQDGPDSDRDGDDTRYTLQVAFSYVFGHNVKVALNRMSRPAAIPVLRSSHNGKMTRLADRLH
jgi:hypothetical protein